MKTAFTLVALLISAPMTVGQNSSATPVATLKVIVSDPVGARISTADVTFKGEKDVVTKTSQDGSVEVSLPFGNYEITIASRGFKTAKYVQFPVDAVHHSLEVVLQLQPCFDCGSGSDPSAGRLAVPTITSELPDVLKPNVEEWPPVGGGPMKIVLLSAAPDDCPHVSRTGRDLLKLEHHWADALTYKNAHAVDCILANEFEDADVDGSLHTRADTLARIPKRKAGSNRLTDLHANIDGNLAVVRGLNEILDVDGKVVARVRFTDTFTYRDGRWQAIAGHETLVAEAHR